MEFQFDFDKSLQAAAFLLELEDGSMDCIRLLGLLYIAERELLAEEAVPLTGDVCKATEYGPELSTVHEIITDRNWRSADWEKFIIPRNYSVRLVADPGRGNLSPCVIDKLKEVFHRYRDMNNWKLVEETHEFPEWKKNYRGGGSAVIPLEDILAAMQAEAGTLEAIREEEAIRRQMEQIIKASRAKLASEVQVAP
jgi:uncharacterized phage-associated protein